MVKTYRKASDLIGYRLRTSDGGSAALRDLVVDLEDWVVRYLTAETDAWAPDREVLVAPRSLGCLNELRRELGVELTFDQLSDSPYLAAGSPITRDFEENFYRYYGWSDYWRAEMGSEVEIGPQVEIDAPIPAAPPATEPLPGEVNADAPGLIAYELLRTWQVSTADDGVAFLQDLLIDDTDWGVIYLEVLVDNLPIRERCLIRRTLVGDADPAADKLYLGVAGDALRQAPLTPYPAPGDEGCRVRTLDDTK